MNERERMIRELMDCGYGTHLCEFLIRQQGVGLLSDDGLVKAVSIVRALEHETADVTPPSPRSASG